MRKIIALFLFFAFLPAVLFAQGMQPVGHVVTISGGSDPAAGTVLLGAATTTNTYYQDTTVAGYLTTTHALTATWAEAVATTTMSKIVVRGTSGATGNAKVMLYNSSRVLIAYATATTTNGQSDINKDFIFSSAPTVTKGATYYISIVSDTDYAWAPARDTSANQISYDTGTYASPPDPMTLTDTGDDGTLGMWGVK
jgi:hypothetical protein